jgi:GTP-binding protein
MKKEDLIFDEVKILVKAGDGGNGAVSFRREKFVPKGGPDGGDGGKGGDIIFLGSKHLKTLNDFKYKRIYKAKNGETGMGKNMYGRSGEDLIIRIPLGTVIKDHDTGDFIVDITEHSQKIIIAKGGKGGLGNSNFATPVRQKPYYSTPGKTGEEKNIWLLLKFIAEVGVIGFPNAGKSSFLARITKANPKIAGYPFTTLSPNLGVLNYKENSITIADIPGLIEGAHTGKGLGDRFLKHIERTQIIIHIIDGNENEIKNSYKIIRKELENYSKELIKKKEIIVINKIDLWYKKEETMIKTKNLFKNKKIFFISCATCEGLNKLMDEVIKIKNQISQEVNI